MWKEDSVILRQSVSACSLFSSTFRFELLCSNVSMLIALSPGSGDAVLDEEFVSRNFWPLLKVFFYFFIFMFNVLYWLPALQWITKTVTYIA